MEENKAFTGSFIRLCIHDFIISFVLQMLNTFDMNLLINT